jgi:ribosomal protein S18 acetylase RimI-like enzyme
MKLLLTNTSVILRSITQQDEALLCEIYSSTRAEEMERVGDWSKEQKTAFVRQQFEAQHVYYQQNYIDAAFWIILKNGQAAGRLYIDENFVDGSIRIIDITLLPLYRNTGIGEGILKDVLSYAQQKKKPVTIHVESFNPAMKLYERLGFTLKDKKNGVYYLLEWKAKVGDTQVV